jgi:hypothetical protein
MAQGFKAKLPTTAKPRSAASEKKGKGIMKKGGRWRSIYKELHES